MRFKNKLKELSTVRMIIIVGTALTLAGATPAWGHGGKTHGGSGFSSFQAIQKSTELYDRLIKMEKLGEEWETGLTAIDVSTREVSGAREYVVRFTRDEGDPESVYFFFDQKGEYAGSNFTGE
jgi:hypothetical protein